MHFCLPVVEMLFSSNVRLFGADVEFIAVPREGVVLVSVVLSCIVPGGAFLNRVSVKEVVPAILFKS